ncbi:MAG: hypothetical protein KDA57_19000 [Planctomycetales bacterium]|nr:hypothetical protein [Planctomycetales bacterium]
MASALAMAFLAISLSAKAALLIVIIVAQRSAGKGREYFIFPSPDFQLVLGYSVIECGKRQVQKPIILRRGDDIGRAKMARS